MTTMISHSVLLPRDPSVITSFGVADIDAMSAADALALRQVGRLSTSGTVETPSGDLVRASLVTWYVSSELRALALANGVTDHSYSTVAYGWVESFRGVATFPWRGAVVRATGNGPTGTPAWLRGNGYISYAITEGPTTVSDWVPDPVILEAQIAAHQAEQRERDRLAAARAEVERQESETRRAALKAEQDAAFDEHVAAHPPATITVAYTLDDGSEVRVSQGWTFRPTRRDDYVNWWAKMGGVYVTQDAMPAIPMWRVVSARILAGKKIDRPGLRHAVERAHPPLRPGWVRPERPGFTEATMLEDYAAIPDAPNGMVGDWWLPASSHHGPPMAQIVSRMLEAVPSGEVAAIRSQLRAIRTLAPSNEDVAVATLVMIRHGAPWGVSSWVEHDLKQAWVAVRRGYTPVGAFDANLYVAEL